MAAYHNPSSERKLLVCLLSLAALQGFLLYECSGVRMDKIQQCAQNFLHLVSTTKYFSKLQTP